MCLWCQDKSHGGTYLQQEDSNQGKWSCQDPSHKKKFFFTLDGLCKHKKRCLKQIVQIGTPIPSSKNSEPDVVVLEPTFVETKDGFIVPAEYQTSWEDSNQGKWSCQDPSHEKKFFFTLDALFKHKKKCLKQIVQID